MKQKYDLDGNLIKPQKCKHCGREKGDHLAKTFNCPFGRSRSFPNFMDAQFFELTESDSKNLPSRPK